jgi:hypothetical protein
MIVGTHRIYVQDSTGANSRPGNPANAVGRILRGKFCRARYSREWILPTKGQHGRDDVPGDLTEVAIALEPLN